MAEAKAKLVFVHEKEGLCLHGGLAPAGLRDFSFMPERHHRSHKLGEGAPVRAKVLRV